MSLPDAVVTSLEMLAVDELWPLAHTILDLIRKKNAEADTIRVAQVAADAAADAAEKAKFGG